MKRVGGILSLFLLSALFCACPAAEMERRDLDLNLTLEQEGGSSKLRMQERDETMCAVLRVPVGSEAKVVATGGFDWTDATAFSFRAKLERGSAAIAPVQVIFFVQDVDFWWFQKLVRTEISSEEWTTIQVPFVPEPADAGTKYAWKNLGHAKPYGRHVLRRARRVGLIVIPDATRCSSFMRQAPITVLLADPHLLMEPAPPSEPPCILDFSAPPTVRCYERFEAAFRLNRTYSNPFDPDIIDVQAHITAPSGRTVTVFGFWFQDYTRRITGRNEELIPVGRPSWRVRFAPSEVGTYTYTIAVRDATGTRTTAPRSFEALDGPSNGFLRISERDYHYLEFDNGEPWFGIGLNLHCTYDYRYNEMVRGGDRLLETERHSLFYDDRLAKLAAAGMNWTELWIASWGFEIEWRGDWRGWAGTGHYNLENAWRLDRALEQCEKGGIYLNLVLSCHGAYSRVHSRGKFDDAEFRHHPYYRGNGGWLESGRQFFRDNRAIKMMQKRLRYLIARYADSTSVALWEMISESDLVDGGRSAALPYVFQMAEMVEAMDPYGHPMTNHYCGHYHNVDPRCAGDPRMDAVAGDAYRVEGYQHRDGGGHWLMYFEPMGKTLVNAAEYYEQFRKPAFITECGGEWFSGPRVLLEADIHSLNWAAWMTTAPATPLTWWEDFVDEHNLYTHYAALARYVAGEDKRNRNLKTRELPTFNAQNRAIPNLVTLALSNKTGGYAWVYDQQYFEFGSSKVTFGNGENKEAYRGIYEAEREVKIRSFPKAFAVIPRLEQGTYDIEIWDCDTGQIIERATTNVNQDELSIALPPFEHDIALKFRRRSD